MTDPNAFFESDEVFGKGTEYPTTYDKFGPSENYSEQDRMKITVRVFSDYRLITEEESVTPEGRERMDIEFDSFMRWINLSDDELSKALELAGQPKVEAGRAELPGIPSSQLATIEAQVLSQRAREQGLTDAERERRITEAKEALAKIHFLAFRDELLQAYPTLDLPFPTQDETFIGYHARLSAIAANYDNKEEQ